MAAPKHALPDTIEAGRVLATLDDWRAITFVLMFLLVIAVVERMAASWRFSKEREKMWDVAQKMGANAEKIGDAINALSVEVGILTRVSSRLESRTGGASDV